MIATLDSPAIALRPYQEQALQAILAARDRGVWRVVAVMPTGTGKTSLFAELIRQRSKEPGFAGLVLAHRAELLDQGARRIGEQCPHLVVSVEAGDQRACEDADVVVAGVQSIGRRTTSRIPWLTPTDLIVDECHHAPADSYQHVFHRYGAYEGLVFVLGVTATPHRLDNKPLHGTSRSIFEEVVYTYTLREAITQGYLVDLRGYRVSADMDLSKIKTEHGDFAQGQLAAIVNVSPVTEHAIRSWAEVARDRKTIVFCVTVDHARDVATVFRARGISSEHVHGGMDLDTRNAVMRRFRSGQTQVLTNVEIATEGFDVPDVGAVLMLRPTKSWGLYAQQIGRGLRVLPGLVDGITEDEARRAAVRTSAKPDCIVVDVVGNTESNSLANLPGIIGLPPKLDLEGKTLIDAAEKWEALDEQEQAALFERPTSFAGLSHKLTPVDLLAELAIPESLAKVTGLSWLKTGEDRYFLSAGSVPGGGRRQAWMEVDQLGLYTLRMVSDDGQDELVLGDNLREAFGWADRKIRDTWPECGAVYNRRAKWRNEAPTQRQLDALRRHKGVTDELLRDLNRGKANDLLTMFIERGGKR